MEQAAPERLIANRYALQATLRRGRAGVVLRATDLVTGGAVAVEEIEPQAEPETERAARWSRIVQGARAAAAVNHPGALTLHDVLLDGDRLYVVTELVEAFTLSELIERHGRLPPRRVAGLGLTAVAPLAQPMPLPAPEQARGEPAGPSADLWALGATMYTAVEGEAPYGDGWAPAADAVLYGEPRPCEHAGPLAPVIGALLARTPALRPAVAEVRRQLQEVAESAGGAVGAAAAVGRAAAGAAARRRLGAARAGVIRADRGGHRRPGRLRGAAAGPGRDHRARPEHLGHHLDEHLHLHHHAAEHRPGAAGRLDRVRRRPRGLPHRLSGELGGRGPGRPHGRVPRPLAADLHARPVAGRARRRPGRGRAAVLAAARRPAPGELPAGPGRADDLPGPSGRHARVHLPRRRPGALPCPGARRRHPTGPGRPRPLGGDRRVRPRGRLGRRPGDPANRPRLLRPPAGVSPLEVGNSGPGQPPAWSPSGAIR